MSDPDTIDHYNARVSEMVERYESYRFEDVHKSILDLIPEESGIVLDVGAGTGRDAAWFAGRGWDVVAVEPAGAMISAARKLHQAPRICWLQDSLPALEKTLRLGLTFDFILVSAVWMHVKPADRARAFRKLVSLLKPGGVLVITLRYGNFSDGRTAYPVSREELTTLAHGQGIAVHRIEATPDRVKRTDVRWETVCLKLPDDGSQALPLLRYTILTESKSSTYKLALLRILVRIADSAVGVVKDIDDEQVAVPLGLVALYWIRMYKPLVESGLPQLPANRAGKGMGFVKEAFRDLAQYSPFDLRVGARFSGGGAASLARALVDAAQIIKRMPAYYIKYPNSSEQVFRVHTSSRLSRAETFALTADFLWGFGQLRIPRHIWSAMCRFAPWIEPLLVNEWIELMQGYAAAQGRSLSYDQLRQALVWLESERDTNLVRDIAKQLLAVGVPVSCVWSGRRLQPESFDIDHCFPFSAWPCGDLWNLLPTDRRINQKEKSDKLVSASTLERSAERISNWWEDAYQVSQGTAWGERLVQEARTSLPMVEFEPGDPRLGILEGMRFKRAALKRDLQLPDWDCGQAHA